jgi:archaellum component FlaC
MKNKFSETINSVVGKAREIADKVGDAVESTVETVAETVEAVTTTVDTIENTAESVAEIVETAPRIDDVVQAMMKDARVGHFLIDILAGMNVGEASAKYFPAEPSTDAQSAQDVESLVAEAEQRGYLRGRNEQIEMKMRDLDQLQHRGERRAPVIETTILNHPRRSVWEN